ncbi:hypothetical protein B0T44_03815 [Nocardia donostiensis]|uniref:Calcineurin-like phosphoesterase domain-containing protein n=1 Tax=Nocardia donostiensis TaxID=1538463 RepID=A0A1W0AZB8_9NOCA|nr:hypothetical protein B0T46_10650 [Nocardia donostiensis]OQS15578.1 hypothetical protein B0T36_09390 [Nocardia donostiensis]OQS22955.1 hypothetical protein B0T44_03815 [Nocardia donostiensis]
MVIVTVLAGIVVLGLLVGLPWHVWRRLVGDTTTRGSVWWWAGTMGLVLCVVLMMAAFAVPSSGAPLGVIRAVAWPGYLCAALLLYLLIGVLVGEVVRPLLLRALSRRDAGTAATAPEPSEVPETSDAETTHATAVARPSAGDSTPDEQVSGTRAAAAGVASPTGVTGAAGVEGVAGRESADAAEPQKPSGSAAVQASARAGTAVLPKPVSTPQSAESAAGSADPGGRAVTATTAPDPGRADSAAAAQGSAPEPADIAAGPGTGVPPAGQAQEQAETEPRPRPISRRLFVSRLAAGATVAAAAATVGTGTYGVLNGPMVRRVTVPLAKLPASGQGFRITLLSDLHLGPALGRGFAERVVQTVNGTRPDLIAVAGDLADGRVADMRSEVAPLAGLRARLGAYYVPGNHEYYSDADEWIAHAAELGMRVLLNSRVALPDFDLAGVDDIEGEALGRGPDVAAALDGRDTNRACVLLAHQPVLVHDAVDHGVDLQLSGHTHGGQLWPGNLLAALANPTLAGLEHYGDTQLYVTRGAGAWGPPVRVAAPSDVTVLELTSLQQP